MKSGSGSEPTGSSDHFEGRLKKPSQLDDPLFFDSPLMQPPKIYADPVDLDRNSKTRTSSSSIRTMSSVSSLESSSSSIFSSFAKPALPKRPLVRAKTSIGSSSSFDLTSRGRSTETKSTDDLMKKLLSSVNDEDLSFDTLDVNDDEDDLDKFCMPSPIAERSISDDGLHKRDLGSPLQKKPIRSKVRRTHSMFYSTKEITETTKTFDPTTEPGSLNDENASETQSLLAKSKIEIFNIKNDSIPRITVETLCKILDGHYKEFYDSIVVVDCRFEYEYKGGHINGSVNVSSQQELEDRFLHNRPDNGKSRLIVFHCEFSSYRGPLMASHLRTCDRNVNQDRYPHLDYPDIVILEGGYKSFFDLQPARCFPQKYVEMNDDKHKTACEKELTRFRRDLKRVSSFNSLSYTASLQQSIHSSSSRGLHRRTATSNAVLFGRRSSLKSNSLDFTRSNVMNSSLNETKDEDEENKPPASLDFGFKFPLSEKLARTTSLAQPPSDDKHENFQPSQLSKRKLSRSFTIANI